MPKVENKQDLMIAGYIGGYEADFDTVNMVLDRCKGRETLNLSISSEGGSYIEAMKMLDRIMQHDGPKNIRISPIAGSAAAVLALDPKAKVMIPENGLIYHHAAQVRTEEARNPEELRKMADELETVGSTLVTSICNRCGKDKKVVQAMLNEGKWFTAVEALDWGLVDEILPLGRKKTSYNNLVLPEMVVAHLDSLNKRSERMALKDVCGKLNIEVTDEMDDEALEAAIVNHNSGLLTQLEKAKETPEEPPKKKEKTETQTKLPQGILNMISSGRELEITNLVTEGKITPAVADELKKKFADKDQIVNLIDDEGEPTDGFDTVIEALKKNETVVNFGGKGHKVVAGGTPEEPQESALVKNAKARGSV